jgi:hypothetical protein
MTLPLELETIDELAERMSRRRVIGADESIASLEVQLEEHIVPLVRSNDAVRSFQGVDGAEKLLNIDVRRQADCLAKAVRRSKMDRVKG